MTREDKFETQVYLKEKTSKLLEYAKLPHKQKEEALDWDPADSPMRHNNLKWDRDKLIRAALRHYIEEKISEELIESSELEKPSDELMGRLKR